MNDIDSTGRKSNTSGAPNASIINSDNEINSHRPSRFVQNAKLGVVICAVLAMFFVNGAHQGFGHMQLMLEDAGVFADKCTEEEQAAGEICSEQAGAIISVQLYGIVSLVFAPVVGHFVDHYGPLAMYSVMTISLWIAAALILMAVELPVFELIFPGFVLYAIVTSMASVMIIPTGLLYEDPQVTSRIIILLNSAFNAGAVTFMLVWGLGELIDASFTTLFIGCFVFVVVLYLVNWYLWIVVLRDSQPERCKDTTNTSARMESIQEDEESDDKPSGTNNNNNSTTVMETVDRQAMMRDGSVKNLPSRSNKDARTKATDLIVECRGESPKNNNDNEDDMGQKSADYVIVADRSPLQQLTSLPFLLIFTVFATGNATCNWYLTTTREFLSYLGDDELNNRYLGIFALMAPFSVVTVPLTDMLISRLGFSLTFQVVHVLVAIQFGIRILSDDLNVQIVSFVIFTISRNIFYGVSFSWLPTILSPAVVGKASGVLVLGFGLFSFVNVPLASLAVSQESFLIPDILHTAMIVPSAIMAWMIGRVIRRENKAKEGTGHQSFTRVSMRQMSISMATTRMVAQEERKKQILRRSMAMSSSSSSSSVAPSVSSSFFQTFRQSYLGTPGVSLANMQQGIKEEHAKEGTGMNHDDDGFGDEDTKDRAEA